MKPTAPLTIGDGTRYIPRVDASLVGTSCSSSEGASPPVRILCVGRHPYLGDHLCEYFRDAGVETTCAVGVPDALARARESLPDVVVCDYDLLATIPLRLWEGDAVLSNTPIVAVSLTRRPDEVHLLDVNGIAGFLYLPGMTRGDAMRMVRAASSSASPVPSYTLPPLGAHRPASAR